MKRTCSHVLLTALLALWAGAANAGEVIVYVSGFALGEGPILVGVFANAEDFDARRPFKRGRVPASGSRVRVVISDIPPGTYGFGAFQDTDGSGKISRNLLMFPNELFGFANGARGRLGPPDFDQIRVLVADDPTTLEIKIE
jgi:uncharacterized protein (DUF2141 family)